MGSKAAVALLLAVALPCFATANYPGYGNGAGLKACPYGMLKNVPHGEWYTGAVKICFCNDGEWEQCYDKSGGSPPYVPPVGASLRADRVAPVCPASGLLRQRRLYLRRPVVRPVRRSELLL